MNSKSNRREKGKCGLAQYNGWDLTHLSQLGLKILFFALWGGKSSVISRGDSFKMAVV